MNLQNRFRKLQRKFKNFIGSTERKIKEEYRKLNRKIRDVIDNMFDKYEKNGELTFSMMTKYDRIDKIDKQVRDIVMNVYSENLKITRANLRDVYRTEYRETINIARDATGAKIRGQLKDQRVTEVINEEMKGLKWADRLRRRRTGFINDLQASIREGLDEGESYTAMTRRLRERVNQDIENPMRIVRTESARVRMKAKTDSLDHAYNQGIKMKKVWVTADDERVRGQDEHDQSDHVRMHGQTVDYKEDFTFPDGTKTFAPTQSGVAKHDINCRCTMRIEFEEE